MTKVKLPREVAEAIEHLRTITHSNHGLISTVEHCDVNPVARTVYGWAFAKSGAGSPDLLMQALVNGYEAEKSPEEKVRDYYEPFSSQHRRLTSDKYAIGFAIVQTLELLGIKIEGVNA